MQAPKRGRKRSAAVSEQTDVAEDSEDGEPTPRKAETSIGEQECYVLIESTPKARAKQRIRTNEAGDAIDITEVISGLYIGKGDVCIVHHLMFHTLTCCIGPMQALLCPRASDMCTTVERDQA